MADFYVGCTMVYGGATLDLNAAPYSLEASTRSELAMTWRKEEVTSPFIEGAYQVSAVRENVTEAVAVWVRTDSYMTMDKAVQDLLGVAERPFFTMTFGHDGVTESWDCQTCQYSVITEQAYQMAKIALVKLQVPRLPRVTRSYADGTTVTR